MRNKSFKKFFLYTDTTSERDQAKPESVEPTQEQPDKYSEVNILDTVSPLAK